jgi:hypothetical protein
LNGGQQERHQYADDRNDDEKLDQRESTPAQQAMDEHVRSPNFVFALIYDIPASTASLLCCGRMCGLGANLDDNVSWKNRKSRKRQ